MESGLAWQEYLRSWAAEEGPRTGGQILASLDARFHRRRNEVGPYFFADLAGTTRADEQAAIDNGSSRPTASAMSVSRADRRGTEVPSLTCPPLNARGDAVTDPPNYRATAGRKRCRVRDRRTTGAAGERCLRVRVRV
jgi:hypothetical protein